MLTAPMPELAPVMRTVLLRRREVLKRDMVRMDGPIWANRVSN